MLKQGMIECRKCGTLRLRYTEDGKQNKCKPCRAKSMREWAARNLAPQCRSCNAKQGSDIHPSMREINEITNIS